MSLLIRKGDFVQATEANRKVATGTPGRVINITQTGHYFVEWQVNSRLAKVQGAKRETHSLTDIEPLTSD